LTTEPPPRNRVAISGCGSDSDSGSGDNPNGADGATATTGNDIDRAFVAAMIPHYESAVAMAEIAQQRAEGAFAKQLADDIVRTQNAEIATLHDADRELAAADIVRGSLRFWR
jgi:uncharacterized protein (DUF305 family)